ncbi:MAG: UDP-N-acetylmuramate dehydrogenase [Bacillota bacterium]
MGERKSKVVRLAERLAALLPSDRLLAGEPMSRHTSFRIGGPAELLALPETAGELTLILTAAREEGVPVLVIGNGSNLLVRDGGLRGLVIRTSRLNHLTVDPAAEGRVSCGAGLLLVELANRAQQLGLAGLEFAGGIPGSVGGAVVMNAGAYGGEMKDVVSRVRAVSADGQERCFSREEMGYGYRTSILQESGWAVTEASFRLTPGDPQAIKEKMAELNRQRAEKQPLEHPSAGSVFRRPPGRYVGPMIEEAGLKGLTIGGAQVSPKHAGFIVNIGGATAADVLALIEEIRRVIRERYGVDLETEIKIVGED